MHKTTAPKQLISPRTPSKTLVANVKYHLALLIVVSGTTTKHLLDTSDLDFITLYVFYLIKLFKTFHNRIILSMRVGQF